MKFEIKCVIPTPNKNKYRQKDHRSGASVSILSISIFILFNKIQRGPTDIVLHHA